ncbi:hypothetical protein GCM10023336_73860 [Streptomyces similanensis]|uniref:Transposase n=1 Tax=Streptomyces similanensis TaxID=1274988 RepID=A0ABP9LKP8_9ACTN
MDVDESGRGHTCVSIARDCSGLLGIAVGCSGAGAGAGSRVYEAGPGRPRPPPQEAGSYTGARDPEGRNGVNSVREGKRPEIPVERLLQGAGVEQVAARTEAPKP